MAKKAQKKSAKKPQTKGSAKAKKVTAKAKKTAAPAKKSTARAKKVAAPAKKAAAPAKKTAAPKKKATPKSAKATKSFSVAEFADMTFLTENGVKQWLQQGLLRGQQSARGDWQIEASNLEVPNVKRLVR
ncbi:MAG: hypothetical protein ACR2PH_02280 [Desulfobulbia bacterium]